MFEKYFPRCYQFVHQHKKWVLGFVLLVTAVAGVGLTVVRYNGNIGLMLPPDKDITRSMDFLRDSSLSDKVVVSLALTDPAKTKKDLFLAVDQLAASLTPPLFTKVVAGFSAANVMDEFSVLQYAPQVLGKQDLASLDSQINAETVSRKMRGIYLQSFRPESILMSSLSRSDPLGIKLLLLEKLRALPASMGYDVGIEDGHFISRDGRHSMLIIQVPVPMMDSQGCKELISTLQDRLKILPQGVSADIISGHLHTVSNERVIKHDIAVASFIASVAFFLLFMLVFRDLRVLFVFFLPMIAVVWAIAVAALVEGELSFLVIGFGTAIAGIIDFGLLVYVALKRGCDQTQTVKLAKLVTLDAATTMFSFFVLYFSTIRGYHQLALFSILCVVFCLVISLFVLPVTLSWKTHTPASDVEDSHRIFRWPAKLIVGLWAALTVVALYFSFSVTFDSDVKKLDGSEASVLDAEKRFHEVWGGKTNQAIFVVTGKNLEQAMEANDKVFREASGAVGNDDFTSLAQFWPSEMLRRENSEQWKQFWKEGREAKLKRLIKETAPAYNFSDDAFKPFFDGLYADRVGAASPDGILTQLKERFVVQKNGEYSIMSFFPDEQRNIDKLAAVTQKYPGTFIVSSKAVSASVATFTAKEVRILAPLAILFNVVLLWLFFRDWKETLIALVPLVTGVVWFVGIMSFLKIPLNVVSIVATIISTGVIVDYGLGMTYDCRYDLRFGTFVAVTLSAATNVIGAGVLLFAKYPPLYSSGIAMVICMVTAYLSSVIVIPSFCSLMGTSRGGGEEV